MLDQMIHDPHICIPYDENWIESFLFFGLVHELIHDGWWWWRPIVASANEKLTQFDCDIWAIKTSICKNIISILLILFSPPPLSFALTNIARKQSLRISFSFRCVSASFSFDIRFYYGERLNWMRHKLKTSYKSHEIVIIIIMIGHSSRSKKCLFCSF